jgi:hypothetical protein
VFLSSKSLAIAFIEALTLVVVILISGIGRPVIFVADLGFIRPWAKHVF